MKMVILGNYASFNVTVKMASHVCETLGYVLITNVLTAGEEVIVNKVSYAINAGGKCNK